MKTIKVDLSEFTTEELQLLLKLGKNKTIMKKKDKKVIKSILRMALGYYQEEEHISNYKGEKEIIPIMRWTPPDIKAAELWLKLRKRETWKDTVERIKKEKDNSEKK